ncbi:PREDICTED: toll-like receptor 5 [Polistes dominula]|uniref:Toll-like receptor 5 n=1 Tax=Polistes dominula TaxID=743375 RepID=A0ABM1INL8_POLDO|nr:PREDICTED: toll-like receptor 5 [Polistes dominula]XP_015181805.1 PREDICTED: toll-like receptor 5 [Polistes dominula]XP_015181806.1 PREDICTED: toll-like receptor 5 [Polistes dominula]
MKSSYVAIVILLSMIIKTRAEVDCNDPNWHNLETNESSVHNCGDAFKNLCRCSRMCYDGHHQYVVNCTNSGFNDTTPLEHLPNAAQVLIFTGNYLKLLPWNIFGTLDRLPNLKVIDMSNNKIEEIRGKTYHHVKRVERLILDFNELSLDPAKSHPRVFSNFVSLLELHLTDAFEDGQPRDLAATLHDIFVNSNLTQLMKLHLEQNEISEFKDPNVFCDLPNLLDLHLGDNALTGLHFNLSCLHKLRFLDLQRNKFTKVSDYDIRTMESVIKQNQSFTVDFSKNSFECSCKLNPFIEWMNKTKVFVRNKNSLQCSEDGKERSIYGGTLPCPFGLRLSKTAVSITLYFCMFLLVVLLCALVYMYRLKLQKKFEPIIHSVNKRVRYSTIATGETREDV